MLVKLILNWCTIFRLQNLWRVLTCDEFTVLIQVQDQYTLLLLSLENQRLHMYLLSLMRAVQFIGQTLAMFCVSSILYSIKYVKN